MVPGLTTVKIDFGSSAASDFPVEASDCKHHSVW